jgi:hypothetical protein
VVVGAVVVPPVLSTLVLSALLVAAGPLDEDVVWAAVGSAEGVVSAAAEVVEEDVEEDEDVVGSADVVGASEVVDDVEDVEEVDDEVGVVSGASELEDEVVSLVRSGKMLEGPALWAATAVNRSAWTKNERLERRMVERM